MPFFFFNCFLFVCFFIMFGSCFRTLAVILVSDLSIFSESDLETCDVTNYGCWITDAVNQRLDCACPANTLVKEKIYGPVDVHRRTVV